MRRALSPLISNTSSSSNMTDLIIILGRQRSGTTALCATLSLDPDVHSFGEVFHSARSEADDPSFERMRLQSEASFFAFREGLFGADAGLSYPSAANQRTVFARFIERLRGLTAKNFLVIDAKYNSWHHLDMVWKRPDDRPFMVDILRGRGAAVIHLIRQNQFKRFCSEHLAWHRQAWHRTIGQELPPMRLHVDPRIALAEMEATFRYARLYQNYFAGYNNYYELAYEDLFARGMLTDAASATVAHALGRPLGVTGPVPLAKVTPPLTSWIENVDEVRGFFGGSPFEGMVAEALDTESPLN